MHDTITSILSEFPQLMLLALLVGFVVWLLAHLTAEPGTQVRVLWGLAEYTKSFARGGNVTAPQVKMKQSTQVKSKSQLASGLVPVEDDLIFRSSLRVHYSADIPEAVAKRSEVRRTYGLRSLLPIENEIKISETPKNSYFFSRIEVDAPGEIRSYYPAFRKTSGWSFELQRRSSGEVFALLAVSEADARRLEGCNGGGCIAIVATSEPWQANTCLVEIPVPRIQSAVGRTVLDDEGNQIGCVDLSLR